MALWLGMSGSVSLAQGWSVKEEISVQQADVSFEQLIPELPAEWRSLLRPYRVAQAPRFGQRLVLTAAQLQRAWLGALGPQRAAGWPLQTPERISLTRGGGEASAGRLSALTASTLQQQLAGQCEQLAVQPTTPPDEELLPPGFTLSARLANSGQIMPRMAVHIDVAEANGRWYQRFTRWAQVSCYRQVWLTNKALRKGEYLQAANLLYQLQDIAGAGPLLSGPQQQNRQLLRDLPAGALVRQTDVSPPYLVSSERQARLQVQSGSVTLELAVQPSQNGVLGQHLLVHTLMSNKAIRAKVLGEDYLLAL
ncbi:flagellar basal body P-ring formation chaperone FlgA [Neisseriaceae bacterium TC5R-5]|nr:flagellar basal body P-ring formation chaperone FlgA [Neisseriaceae bacterium TC5R-5]